jgi:hypothetical protein
MVRGGSAGFQVFREADIGLFRIGNAAELIDEIQCSIFSRFDPLRFANLAGQAAMRNP